jgi:antitoxin ParD1/3/4
MPAVAKITIALTAAQADTVRRAVAEGRYASTSEAIREAVREWQERRDLLGFTVEELRRLADEGAASGDGLLGTIDEVKAAARRRLPA